MNALMRCLKSWNDCYRISVLESSYNALKAEKEQVEGELAASKEETNALTIEINRLNTLLDHAKAKVFHNTIPP